MVYYKPPEDAVAFSIRWPKSIVDIIDKQRGEYITRNMYVLKLVQEHLAETKGEGGEQQKEGRGAQPTKRATRDTIEHSVDKENVIAISVPPSTNSTTTTQPTIGSGGVLCEGI